MTAVGEATAQRPPAARVEWVDYARGIGIVLVVVGHTLGGLKNAGVLASDPLHDWIYSFHMPLFFLLSGLFVTRAADGPAAEFVAGKVRTVAYPYLVWSVLQTLVQFVLAPFTNQKVAVASLLTILYRPVMQFWFLYTLFAVFLLFLGLYKLGARAAALLAVGIAVYLYAQVGSLGPWGVPYSVANHFLYFALGVAVAGNVHGWVGGRGPARSVGLALLAFALLTAAVLGGIALTVWGKPLAAAIGMAGTALIASVLAGAGRLSFLHTWGRKSLQIFVAHTIASAGLRIVLQKLLGIDAPVVHILGGIAIGIAAPLLLDAVCERVGFRYAFTWPKATPAVAAARAGRSPL